MKKEVLDMTLNNKQVTITSVQLVELINQFRQEEGNRAELQHKDLLKSIRNEIETLEKAGIVGEGNFSPSSYINQQNKSQPCYSMNKAGVLQMLNKESAVVRYKTVQYIEKLERKTKHQLTAQEELKLHYLAIEEQSQEIQEVKAEVADLKENMPLFNVDCKEIQSLVKKKGTEVLGGYKSNAYNDNSLRGKVYSDIHKQIKREFGIERYEAIKRSQLNIAKQIIRSYKAPLILIDDINALNSQTTLFDKGDNSNENFKE